MWRRFLQWVMDRRPTKAYVVGGEVLFYRAHLFTLFGRVWYLHHYLRSDPDDRGWHDHPMRAVAVILAGGYVEERLVGFALRGCAIERRRLRPGSINRLDEWTFHRVVIPKREICVWQEMDGGEIFWPVEVQPTSWSLFISEYVPGKAWGFMAGGAIDGVLLEDERQKIFIYEEAGGGIDDEEPWWLHAPKGRKVCRGES